MTEYQKILKRIVEGAEFIEFIGPNDPKYNRALEKYDRLCQEAQELRKRMTS